MARRSLLAQDQQFLAIHFDFGAGILGVQDFVADGYVHGNTLAIFITVARPIART